MITLVKDTIDNKDIDELIGWLQTYPRLTKGPLTLELEKVPEINKSCEKCMYLNAGKEFI